MRTALSTACMHLRGGTAIYYICIRHDYQTFSNFYLHNINRSSIYEGFKNRSHVPENVYSKVQNVYTVLLYISKSLLLNKKFLVPKKKVKLNNFLTELYNFELLKIQSN